ncbi:MAG: hypothetical protein ACTSRG_05670 [Candidatus Helarchaeota archaeon]
MKREVDIPEDLDNVVEAFIKSQTRFNNISEFAVAAFEYFLKNQEFLQSNISVLDK